MTKTASFNWSRAMAALHFVYRCTRESDPNLPANYSSFLSIGKVQVLGFFSFFFVLFSGTIEVNIPRYWSLVGTSGNWNVSTAVKCSMKLYGELQMKRQVFYQCWNPNVILLLKIAKSKTTFFNSCTER